MLIARLPLLGKSEEKLRALSLLRFNPYSSTVTFDNLLADRQSNSGATILLFGVEPLEDSKDLFLELRFDPGTGGTAALSPCGLSGGP